MQELILALKEKGLSISICEAELHRALRSIISAEDGWQAAARSRLPFPTFAAILEILQEKGYIDDGHRLTPSGEKAFLSWNVRPLADVRCSACGSGILLDLDLKQRFLQLRLGQPEPIVEYDQGHLTIDSVLLRAALLKYHGDLEDKSIAILGDDDLLGLALALTDLPKEVVVFEIDKRLVEFINSKAKEQGLRLEAYLQDLRRPLPKKYRQSFDVFLTDPLETIEGFMLFFRQGLFTLKPGGGKAAYFGLSRIEASATKWHKLQRHILSYKLVLTDIWPDFSLYENWPYLLDTVKDEPFLRPPSKPWFRSSFLRLETLPGFLPPISSKSIDAKNKEIYADEEAIKYKYKHNININEHKCSSKLRGGVR